MRPDNHMYRSALDSRKSAPRNRFASMAAVLAAVALAVLAACGDSGTGPDTEVAAVSVAPATRTRVKAPDRGSTLVTGSRPSRRSAGGASTGDW